MRLFGVNQTNRLIVVHEIPELQIDEFIRFRLAHRCHRSQSFHTLRVMWFVGLQVFPACSMAHREHGIFFPVYIHREGLKAMLLLQASQKLGSLSK